MFLHWHWQNEAITIILKDLQYSTSISTIDIPPVSINTTLLNNIKNSADNIIITGDLNAKHTYFNCSKVNRGIALKKALYDADLFIAENSTPTHRDSRTISSDITDYIIFSLAIFNKIQNLFIHNDLSPEISTFFFKLSTNINKSISPSVKVKVYHKNYCGSISSSLSSQLTIP